MAINHTHTRAHTHTHTHAHTYADTHKSFRRARHESLPFVTYHCDTAN